MVKSESVAVKKTNKTKNVDKSEASNGAKVKQLKKQQQQQPNKYEKLLSKKRKLDETSQENKENSTPGGGGGNNKSKKPRLDDEKPAIKKKITNGNGNVVKKQLDGKVVKKNKFQQNGDGAKKMTKKFEVGKDGKKFAGAGGKKVIKNGGANGENAQLSRKDQKNLKAQRKQKKLTADHYSLSINIKKIWETLRRAETTDETRKKLCSSLYDQVKGKIKQVAFAHDTVRVIECLIQYGNENHRNAVFAELKDEIVEMSKSKYSRFILKKMLTYGSKEQKSLITKSFTGKVTKLIKHSYACKLVESIFNEHASFAERNKMLMEFYDPTLGILVDPKNSKNLTDILATNEVPREKIMTNLKEILTSCIDKTLLMFSLIHRVFLEYMNNCTAEERSDMIEQLGEHLVHMVHTKDGSQVAMECIWHSTAKQRKKIIKGMKSFVVKMALDECGHQVLESLFDSVDDTKLVQKGILEEMFRSTPELFANDYGRKLIAYLSAPRDPRFFLKDYSKRLEKGDQSETSKKDPEKRRAELFEHSKPYFLEHISKEIKNWLYDGTSGILMPVILQKIGKDANDVTRKIAEVLLEKPYQPSEEVKKVKQSNNNNNNNNNKEKKEGDRQHIAEDATAHFIIKKLLHINKDANKEPGTLSLAHALLSSSNAKNMLTWSECNRGCFLLVNLIESSDESDKKIAISLIKEIVKELDLTKPGAKLLKEKLQ